MKRVMLKMKTQIIIKEGLTYSGEYVVIRTDGIVEVVPAVLSPKEPPSGKERSRADQQQLEASLEQLRELLGGPLELFEQNYVNAKVFINGDGRLTWLQCNPVATVLFDRYLVGAVVICKKGRYSDGFDARESLSIRAALQRVLDEFDGMNSVKEIDQRCRTIFDREEAQWRAFEAELVRREA
jgi:hypothetical protein